MEQVVARSRTRTRVAAYVALTKPRIIELLLVTTLPTMVVADAGLPPLGLVVWTLLGGTLAAGGANALNMVVDRDIDAVMARTRNRPLVTGALSAAAALRFAVALEVAAFLLLWGAVNLLSAVLAVGATLFYVFVYTLWLKRTSTRNIVIGGAAGAVPVLVGWTAVRGELDWPPLILFAVIFYWTPPHFWALAVRYRDDYAAAHVPMLPAVAGVRTTAVRILGYSLALWGLTVLFAAVADMGALYLAAAVGLGALFTWYAVQLLRSATPERAMRLFTFSISYITLLFGAMALDQLLRTGV
jgi:protoheme IX farnesyltransferase